MTEHLKSIKHLCSEDEYAKLNERLNKSIKIAISIDKHVKGNKLQETIAEMILYVNDNFGIINVDFSSYLYEEKDMIDHYIGDGLLLTIECENGIVFKFIENGEYSFEYDGEKYFDLSDFDIKSDKDLLEFMDHETYSSWDSNWTELNIYQNGSLISYDGPEDCDGSISSLFNVDTVKSSVEWCVENKTLKIPMKDGDSN